MEVAALTTRQAKEQGVSREELHERWQSRGEEIGLDAETISQTFDPGALLDPTLGEISPVSHKQIGEAATAHASHFERRDAIRAVAGSQRAGAPASEVVRMADEFLASDQVLRVSETPGPSASPPAASGSLSARRSPPPSGCRARHEGRPGSWSPPG